ncbi:hypothetical protein PHYSODRAFT_503825 [Phytophthora sojae]|uniref:Uncharacterized protein n=1 Tax=Phytophthora sojae (strain P6497) TaxID=1094619 RepID=G4ZCY4_PHYSP|nr:hypothetical protein PHYSODRAFT_503825 [Phytophthora sojae]EGZ18932.1 hypothetical protein PHYSODRAFT_503825 [Phytophthora sojae]|eukprot:XP_009527990.1 hypothetical protein PHYSODRAFT_503825 [Phytophthora sojae]
MMRHIMNGIEAKLDAPMPEIRDKKHAIELFNIGYGTLRLKPSKRKRRAEQLKLTTVLRLIRQADQERNEEDSQPPKPQGHTSQSECPRLAS